MHTYVRTFQTTIMLGSWLVLVNALKLNLNWRTFCVLFRSDQTFRVVSLNMPHPEPEL